MNFRPLQSIEFLNLANALITFIVLHFCRLVINIAYLSLLICVGLILLDTDLIYAEEGEGKSPPALKIEFEGNQPLLKIEQSTTGIRVLEMGTSREHPAQGKGCEEVLVQANQLGETLVLSHTITPAKILDDIELSLQIHSPVASCVLCLEITFPETIDPRTNQLFVGNVFSTPIKATRDWETLKINISKELWQERTRLWKAQLRPQHLNPRNAQITKAMLFVDCDQGKNYVRVDNLIVSPFVEVNQKVDPARIVKPSNIKFGMGRITVNELPFLPLVIPYHGEDLGLLKKSGFNVVWVDEAEISKLVGPCEELGLWMTTSPPVNWESIENQREIVLDQRLGEEFRRVLFWNLGTRVDFKDREKFRKIAQKIREIDPWHRPLCIDVRDAEEVFSRDVEMLSISRHVMHTTSTLQDYRSHILTRSSLAEPGAFLLTHIQTETSPLLQHYCDQLEKASPFIEPEQLRLQTYAALSCGIRGISYWKSKTWDIQQSNYKEHLLACAQLHQEIKVLEPFLATGSVVDQFEFEVSDQLDQQNLTTTYKNGSQVDIFRVSKSKTLTSNVKESQAKHHATVIQSDWGHLILACALDESAQYAPPTQTSPEARFVVRGVPESALAWEVTPTALVPLEMQRVAGGLQISLKRTNVFHRFDQTAAILISSSRDIEAQVQQVINQVKTQSAESSLALAETKWQRVRQVLSELTTLGQGSTNDAALSRFVDQLIAESQKKFIDQDFHMSRLLAARAMQIMRNIQYAHWLRAKNNIQHPNSTAFTACFQTLPEFWKLMARVGTSSQTNEQTINASGEFEDLSQMQQAGWQRELTSDHQVISFLELHPSHQGSSGIYSLRMTCIPKSVDDMPLLIRNTPIKLLSPKISLKKGDLLHVSGYLTIDQPIRGSLQGIRIYDSILDTPGSIIWKQSEGWKSFQLLREIPTDLEYQLTTELTAMGDCRLDHFKFKILQASATEINKPTQLPEKKPNSFTNSLEFLERLSPLRGSKNDSPKPKTPDPQPEP